MDVAALFSGGKDSSFALRLVEEAGHEIAYLVTLVSKNPDSYMFHTINNHLTCLQAKSMRKQLITGKTTGIKEKELLDLKVTLEPLEIQGIVSGAIASTYQKKRINQICKDLGLIHLSPLWQRERISLVTEMLDNGMKIIISAVAAQGLDDSILGKPLDYPMLNRLMKLNEMYGVDVCGEGGEYESMVLDAPWFEKEIIIEEAIKTWDGISGRYLVKKASLEPKLHKK
jgi:ABC transporter with metal-binding/Fe-S-binding domain ATP-binding protein